MSLRIGFKFDGRCSVNPRLQPGESRRDRRATSFATDVIPL